MTTPDMPATAVPGRLKVGADGKITGPARIECNDPFPTINGTPGGGSPLMMGVVMHTEDGYEQGTIETFNNPASQASAFFSIGGDGVIHQYGPVGANWMAWAQAAGNPMWYSIEDSDGTHPSVPLTQAQVIAFAQILECLSAFAGFPLQLSDSPSVRGLGWHGMGGVAWGNHPDCPGEVRKAQRPAIIAMAREIRAGGAPAQIRCPHGEWTRVGGVEVQPATHDVVLKVRLLTTDPPTSTPRETTTP